MRASTLTTLPACAHYYGHRHLDAGGAQMRCSSCGHDNSNGAKFCSECATSLQLDQTCPNCGTSNAACSRFCNECAQPLAEATSLTRTPTPAPSPALPASVADGRYQVERFLGEGVASASTWPTTSGWTGTLPSPSSRPRGWTRRGSPGSATRRRRWDALATIRISSRCTASARTAG